MAKKLLFAVISPLGYRIVLTRNRWREIIRFKHPTLAGHVRKVRDCLVQPKVIRTSVKDPDVHLYYRSSDGGYLCVVVGIGDSHQRRFVITAYLTDAIKTGTELWTE